MAKKNATPVTQNPEVLSSDDKKLNSRLQECPIAIVGMASVFADAKNLEQYWDNIFESVDAIMDVPPSRWAIDDYYSEDKKAVDKSYCKRGGFLPELDFDPMEFGLPPNILELTDIAQLLSLVVARDVLNDAGIGEGSEYDMDKVGITLGVGGGQKQITPLTSRLQGPILDKVLAASGIDEEDRGVIIDKFKKAYIGWEENSFPGMLGNVIAGRIANRFDLGGTNCVVDAACAGSLAAMKLAVSDLLEYRSEVMISGGVCCDNSPFMYMSFSKTPAFTTNEDIRPFDQDSKGMMIGEGIGMMAFKRLEDAERDGDKIYAVLKGIGTSSDGRFKSIYAPRPDGQAKALKRAYDDAGFDPKTCGLIEAHGTGTMAGDAAEFSGLNKHFSPNNDDTQHIALGSVKSQIGHTKSAAGSAGMIKAALALHHKILPATINVDRPNPSLDIENSPLYINSETRPWMPREDGIPRRAGVSSFGFGGTNYHFVMEEYQPGHAGQYRLNHVPQTLLITAADEKSLIAELTNWRNKLTVDEDDQPYVFNALVTTCGLKTPAANLARCGFVAKNAVEALSMLDAALKQFVAKPGELQWSVPTGIYYRQSGLETNGKVVALFSGQGSQYVNMGSDLACNFPTMLQTAADMDSEFSAAGLGQLSSVTYPIPVFSKQARDVQEDKLRLTQHAQPAIGTFSLGLYKTLEQAGFKADFTAGHSFGELTALWAAGVLSDSDYMMLARSRGQAMAVPDDKEFDAGAMIAVVGDPSKVAEDIKAIDDISIANYNSNNQVVVAGKTSQVLVAFDELKAKGYKVVQLPVSAAFHTPLVGHAQKPFAKAIDAAKFNAPKIPVFSNATGKVHSNKAADIKKSLKNHILESVHFNTEIDNIYADGGRVFIEFGPKNVLTRLVDNILKDKTDVTAIAVNANPKKSGDLQMRLAAIQMAVLGVELDDVDPHSAVKRPLVPRKMSPLAMKLSAASYVSDKTRKQFDETLTDGWSVKQAKATPVAVPAPKVVEKIVEKVVEKIVYVQVDPAQATSSLSDGQSDQQLVSSIERSVGQFVKHQQQLLDVHEQYMQGPQEYAKTFQSVLSTQAGTKELPESLDRTLGMYHEFQSETLRVHEQYLNNQTENMSAMLDSVTGAPASTSVNVIDAEVVKTQIPAPENKPASTNKAPVVSVPHVASVQSSAAVAIAEPAISHDIKPVATPAASVDVAKIQQVMLDVVADKTGYPAEMLELAMDMEADLGIDSIKRVEILGSVQELIPDLPELNPEDLAELRTLGEIVDYMKSKAQSTPVALHVVETTAAPVAVTSIPAAAEPAVDLAKIQSVMMDVVADKTGYPAEMLELGMDMEADLGIDSIKRVEILGAVQETIPDLPELNPEDLAELRTLGQIVEYMQSKVDAAPAAVSQVTSAPTIDLAKIQSVMMDVVAEKTGYPAEMLELGMDMEADLGIDSIKRVEILGAVQETIPDLPELNPEDLAELRTLGQIVGYMEARAQSKVEAAPAPLAQVTSAPTIDLAKIQSVMMDVVAEKTGYPAEMLELGMDMEADLGIDSIKRVEILGAVQETIPDLPELNPEDLAELRTLGQIVGYMEARAQSKVEAAPAPLAQVTSAPTIDLAKIQSVMMAVVAEKTGYPAEMLELGMDMEADLGIDSIKRVEILGAVQETIPDLPELNPEDLAELRTLGQIVGYMEARAQSKVEAAPAPLAQVTSAPTIDLAKIQSVMMDVVAEKTGYPAEMLELGMDMEADLGIDSIKRVEILGAVQETIPDLPELNPEDLAELRTLGQIVGYMEARAQSKVDAAPAPAPLAQVASAPAIDLAKIQSVMMSVVAEKTGYPSDMLELGMDMEADLGIDSIKRVEILGAVQETISDLPELNPEDLAELRTLGQIVDYMQTRAQSATGEPVATATPVAVTAQAENTVTAGFFAEQLMIVVAEKTGYPVEMLELDMDMEADLGIDSIKRVEILGAVQDAVEGLPEVNPEALAEMRTLKEIVDSFTSVSAAPEVTFEPAPSSTVVIQRLASVNKIEQKISGGNVLIVDDGSGATVKLADNLSKTGWKVTALKPSWVKASSSKAYPKAVNTIEINAPDDAEIQQLISQHDQLDAVIYVQAKNSIKDIEYPQASKQGLMLAFLLAKHCNVSVATVARPSFMVVTRQGGSLGVAGSELDTDLVQGGLNGLLKTISHEWPAVFCRAVDVSGKLGADKVAVIVSDELLDADTSLKEVAYDNTGRLTLVGEATDSYKLTAGNSIDADSVFLVSGGAKGVTAHCVIRLAKEHQSKFILLGRSAFDNNEADWAKGIAAEAELKKAAMQAMIAAGEKPTPVKVSQFIKPVLANREIAKTLNAIKAVGGQAEYVSVDVTDSDSVQAAVKPVVAQFGEVTGIIHGAGVLADKFIEQKTLADFESVYRTKIDGLLSMLSCAKQDKIKHLVLFSSGAGFYGNPGQSDYSIANEILNKTAYRFKALQPQAQVLSFNWGPWDGGMVTPELKRMFAERGVYIIPLDAGAELLLNELAAKDNRCPQILVGNDLSSAQNAEQQEGAPVKKPEVSRLSKTLQAANNEFLADHVIGGNRVLPTVCAMAWMADAAESVYHGFKFQGLENYKLFKGVVFDGAESGEHTIELTRLSAESKANELRLDAKVSSLNSAGKPVYHYGAELLLTAKPLEAKVFKGEFAPLSNTGASEQAKALYHNGTLFHGESLQGIQEVISCDDQGLLLACQVPAVALDKQGEFPLAVTNVFANDLVYQAMLVWVRERLGLGSLPSSTKGWTVYRQVQPGELFYLQLNVVEQTGSKLVADIALIDADHLLLAEVTSAEVTASESLNELFKG